MQELGVRGLPLRTSTTSGTGAVNGVWCLPVRSGPACQSVNNVCRMSTGERNVRIVLNGPDHNVTTKGTNRHECCMYGMALQAVRSGR